MDNKMDVIKNSSKFFYNQNNYLFSGETEDKAHVVLKCENEKCQAKIWLNASGDLSKIINFHNHLPKIFMPVNIGQSRSIENSLTVNRYRPQIVPEPQFDETDSPASSVEEQSSDDNQNGQSAKRGRGKGKRKRRGRSSNMKTKRRKQKDPDIYNVEKLLDHRMVNGRLQFLVNWSDYPLSQSTWEDRDNIIGTSLVTDYYEKMERDRELQLKKIAEQEALENALRMEAQRQNLQVETSRQNSGKKVAKPRILAKETPRRNSEKIPKAKVSNKKEATKVSIVRKPTVTQDNNKSSKKNANASNSSQTSSSKILSSLAPSANFLDKFKRNLNNVVHNLNDSKLSSINDFLL